MGTVSLLIKKGQKKTRGYSSGSFALHKPFTVASITDSSLSSNLLSCASKRLRTELFLTSLLGNIYLSLIHIYVYKRQIHISATSENHINAMDMNSDYGDGANPVILKSEFILSLCEPVSYTHLVDELIDQVANAPTRKVKVVPCRCNEER